VIVIGAIVGTLLAAGIFTLGTDGHR